MLAALYAVALDAGTYAMITGFFTIAGAKGRPIRWRARTPLAAAAALVAMVVGIVLVPDGATIGEQLRPLVPALALAAGFAVLAVLVRPATWRVLRGVVPYYRHVHRRRTTTTDR